MKCFGRLTGKPEVLAWRHLTIPTVSDSQVCKVKSGRFTNEYIAVSACVSLRVARSFYLATLFGHAQAPFVLCRAIRRPITQLVDKISFRQPHCTDNKRLMLDTVSDLGRRGPL